MRITVAGTGYVGLVTGVCLAEHGHQIVCVDVDFDKIHLLQTGKCPIYEPDVNKLLFRNKARLEFSTDYKDAYKHADIIFICVGTPEKKDGSANLSYVYQVAGQIAECVEQDCIVVVKSTVPIGTNEKIESLIRKNLAHPVKISVASNPEFLSQGTAVQDTLHASRIIIGADDARTKDKLRDLYSTFHVPILYCNRRSAEMIKYASNDFLALKISYINEVANLCETIGANVEDVAAGMGYDPRIGDRFLKAGIGYGGSCFPKDTKALDWFANFNDNEIKTIKAAIEVNEQQKLKLLKKAKKYFDSFENLVVAVLGLTFKPNTDDLREAPSLVNIPILLEDGAQIRAWDPVGEENFKKKNIGTITYCNSIEEALEQADLCLILTEWEQIRNFDVGKFAKLMRHPIVLDGRNCFDLEEMKKLPIQYESIGRC